MFWEYLIVAVIVLTASVIVVRKYYLTLTGKGSCCEGCSISDTCKVKEQQDIEPDCCDNLK